MTAPAHWITDRPPTEADSDSDGDVLVCTTPRFGEEDWMYEKWNQVTPGWPWRRTKYWTPPTPAPEPTPAAPEPEQKAEEAAPRFRVGQVWRTRGGVECTVVHIWSDYESQFPIYTDLHSDHHHSISGKSILNYGENHEDDLVELISEPSLASEPPTSPIPEPAPASPEPEAEKATRGFWSYTSDYRESDESIYETAVATDYTAWQRFVNSRQLQRDVPWEQVRPLPQPGEE